MGKVAKAISGAVAAGATAVTAALLDNQITATEYVTIAAGILLGFFAVWATSNSDA